jgi:hypothetical protein
MLAAASVATLIFASPALAGENEAKTALSRADAKIEMVTRQAGAAGNTGDQSFNMARQRAEAARTALKAGNYDTAQDLADEAALLADLASERAKLADLKTSHGRLTDAVSPSVQ